MFAQIMMAKWLEEARERDDALRVLRDRSPATLAAAAARQTVVELRTEHESDVVALASALAGNTFVSTLSLGGDGVAGS